MIKTPWADRADEILSDGQWHDGMTVVREMEKLITPGRALRKAELVRATSSRARRGEEQERKIERSNNLLIAMGKRTITQSVVHARIKGAAWEVEPWPIPEAGWRIGGWRLRDLRRNRIILVALAHQHHISLRTARQCLEGVEHSTSGRYTYVTDLAAFEANVQAYKAGTFARRSAAALQAAQERRLKPRTYYTLGDLSAHSQLGSTTVRQLQQENPQLDWKIVGRSARLDADRLPEWDKIAEQYHASAGERRSAANKKAARKRASKSTPAEPSPVIAFTDPELTGVFARYLAGDKSLRTEVFAGMRRAFHAADHEAGDQ